MGRPYEAAGRTDSRQDGVHMKPSVMLTVASLLSILLLSLHIADDIVRGFSGGGLENIFGILILVVLLCATLLWSDRRWGLIIVLLGSLLTAGMPVIHMRGAGVGVGRSAGAFFFIWTLYALGVTGTFGAILSARALWSARPGEAKVTP
jgi:hypothetical protein